MVNETFLDKAMEAFHHPENALKLFRLLVIRCEQESSSSVRNVTPSVQHWINILDYSIVRRIVIAVPNAEIAELGFKLGHLDRLTVFLERNLRQTSTKFAGRTLAWCDGDLPPGLSMVLEHLFEGVCSAFAYIKVGKLDRAWQDALWLRNSWH